MALNGFMSKVSFVNKVPMLMKATSADPTLPAGHVYEDISRISYESLEQSDVLVEFLTERLKKSSPYIKLKVLLIMKAVVTKGHEEFRCSLSKQSQGIRDAKSYSGPPDPLHGDSPFVNVREAAGQLLQLLFDTDRIQRNSSSLQNTWNKQSAKMEGFGSSNFGGIRQPSLGNSGCSASHSNKESGTLGYVFQRVKDNMSYVFQENVSAIAKYQNMEGDSGSGYQHFTDVDRKFVSRPSQTFNLLGGNSSQKEQAEFTDSSDWRSHTVSSFSDSNFQTVSTGMSGSSSSDNSEECSSAEQWSQEALIVDKITTPGGVRLNPGKSELQEFVNKCESLNFENIVELLKEKLQNSDYKVQMKSLFAIETLLNSNIRNACDIIASTLTDDLEKLSLSNQTAVKNKSNKLLHILKPRQKEPVVSQNFVKQFEDSNESLLVHLPSDVQSYTKVEPISSNDTSGDSGNDLLTLLDEISMKDKEQPDNSSVSESISHDLLGSGFPGGHRPEDTTVHGSDSVSLLDLDLFAGNETHSAQSARTLNEFFSHSAISEDISTNEPAVKSVSIGPQLHASKAPNLNLDPFAVVNVNSDESNSTKIKHAFDFLLQDIPTETTASQVNPEIAPRNSDIPRTITNENDLMDNGIFKEISSQSQPGSQQFPRNSSQFSENVAQFPRNKIQFQAVSTQFQGPSPQFQNIPRPINYGNGIAANSTRNEYSSTVSQGLGRNRSLNSMMMTNVPRASPMNSNGFEFISSGKKIGALDLLVKEAMEASKRK